MTFLILAGAACGSVKIRSLGQNRISANTWRVSRLAVHQTRVPAHAGIWQAILQIHYVRVKQITY